jgi:hypothetical protein
MSKKTDPEEIWLISGLVIRDHDASTEKPAVEGEPGEAEHTNIIHAVAPARPAFYDKKVALVLQGGGLGSY